MQIIVTVFSWWILSNHSCQIFYSLGCLYCKYKHLINTNPCYKRNASKTLSIFFCCSPYRVLFLTASVCGSLYLLHVKQMCIPLLGDTERLREKEKKRGLRVRELVKTVATGPLLLIKFPSFSHPSPYMHILIKSSPQCLYVWQLGCLSILLSYSHHELLSQACSQIHLLYCSSAISSLLLSSFCVSKTVS